MGSYFRFIIFILLSLQIMTYADRLESVRIQLKWKHQFQFAGYYAALEKGFFEEEGIKVSLLERELKHSTDDNINVVLDGNAEYGVADAGLLLAKYEQKPVVLLAQIFQHSPLVLISKKGSGIISPYEMIDKTIMYDASDVQFKSMFQNTIGGKGDVKTLNHSGDLNDFITGKVDVISSYLTNEPYILNKKNIEINIIRPQNYGIDFYGDNLFTSENEIKQYPERVKRVRRAVIKGWKYAIKNREEIVQVIKNKYAKHKDVEHLRYEAKITSQMILADLIDVGSIDIERFKMIADTYFKSGQANTKKIPESFFYKINRRQELELSNNERLWLKEHPKILVASDPSLEPYEFVDKNGIYNGIAIDYLELLENIIPVKFKYVKDKTWQELVDLGKNKEVDIFSCITKTKKRSSYLNFTQPYISTPISIFSRIDVSYIGDLNNLKGKTVVVVEGYAIHELLKTNHPEIMLKTVKNISEAIKIVDAKKAFCFIGNQMSTSYYLAESGNTHIKISGETPYKNDLSIGVRDDWDIFSNILQRAIDQISEREKTDIFNNWITIKYEHEFDAKIIWQLTLGAFLIILVFIIWNRMLKRQVEKRSRELSRSIINLHEEVEKKNKMMNALNKSDEKFKAIYDQAPVGLAVINSETGYFLEVNGMYCRITGYSEEELKKRSFKDITFKDDLQKDLNNMKLLNKNSISTYEIEKRYIHKSGKIIWISLIVVPLWNDENHKEHLSIVQDISEKKESDKQKLSLERQLRETQKMEAIGTLAGGIAHDFNNILGAMLGFTDLTIENLKEDDSNRKRLEYVLQGGKRAKELIDQILTFSREREEELKPLFAKPIIKEVLKLLRASIPSTIEIESEVNSDSYILADAAQIHQVIMNICTNAKYAMKENGGILKVKTEDININDYSNLRFLNSESGKLLKISISDTGKGIDRDVVNRIFEPFFTTKKKGEGTGLGLSVVHGIIKSYGGYIDVNSKPLKGTEFDIYIPIVQYHVNIGKDENDNEQVIKNRGGNILIVDDEKLMLEMLESVLVSLDYKVTVMENSIDAYNHLKENFKNYDLVISDITMPLMKGDELCSKIMTLTQDLPFLLTTGYAEKSNDVIIRSSGAKRVMNKPFVKSEIASVVFDILNS